MSFSVISLILGVAAFGAALLPLAAASAATPAVATPYIYAPPNTVIGESSGTLSLQVTLSAPGTSTVTVNWSVPTDGCNYALSGTGSGTLTFTPGVTTQNIPTLTVNQCNGHYLNSASLTLSGATNGIIADPLTVIDVVGDNNPVSTPGLYIRGNTVDTTAGMAQVPVMLGGPAGQTSTSTVTVNYTTVNGSAVSGTDYSTTSGTLSFGPGQTEQNISVPITDRTTAAPSRNFTVVLSAPSNAVIVQSTATVTIGASAGTQQSSPYIYAPPNTVIGEVDGWVDLPVTLGAPSPNQVTVGWSVTADGCNYALSGDSSGTLTFVPGQVLQVIRMQVNQCNVNYLNSSNLTLSGATNGVIADPLTVIDVVGDNNLVSTPGLYIRGNTVDTTAGMAQVPVMLGGPPGATSASTVTVKYTTVNGSAVSGTDYSTTSGTLSFGPGQTEQSISVPITDRTTAAPSRSFTVVLSAPSNASIVQSTATVTIGASGGTSQSSPYIYAPPNTLIGEADGWVDLPVTLGAPSPNQVPVNWSVTADGCDYALSGVSSGTLIFVPGQVVRVIRMQVNQCNVNYLNSSNLTLSGASGGIIADPLAVIDVVGDNNLLSTPGLYIRGNTVDTTAGMAQVPVMLGGPVGATSASTVTVNYTTVNGSAVSGTDYSTTSGTLSFGPGQTEQTISVPIVDRTSAAASRSFTVVLSAPSNAAIVQSTATVTIGASGGTQQSSPYIYAPPNTLIGEADGWVDLPVTLGAPSPNQVTVGWSVTADGCDYALSGVSSGTLTYVPGQVLQVIRMQVNQCNYNALNSANLTLSGATNGIIADPLTVIDVVGDNNLVSTPGLYIRGNTVDTTAGMAQVPVMLGGPSGQTSDSTVTVNYTTVNGSAVSGTDYSTTSGTLTFGPGQTEQSISVPIIDRTSTAASRSFTVVLSAPSNASVVQSTATVTIGASGGTQQSSPNIYAPANTEVSETSGWVDLPVTLGARSPNQVAVNWSVTADGCNYPLSGVSSGTLIFVPGQVLRVIRMQVNDCNFSSDATATLTLSDPVNGIIEDATTTITVTPSQAVPTITSFTPTSGPVGTTITIKGTNLE
ncbi:MAG: Calx-beta domain-containing protein, partial [Acidimicrobiales bacterium]